MKDERKYFKLRIAPGKDFDGNLEAYLFDRTGDLVERAPVKGNQVQLEVSERQVLAGRFFIAPQIPEDQEAASLAVMDRLKAYEPVLRPGGTTGIREVIQIPDDLIDHWVLCLCWVRGQVLKVPGDHPICKARVHICEVDRWPIFILRLPEDEVLRLRDDLLEWLDKPIIKWPQPLPDPPPFRQFDRLPFRFAAEIAESSIREPLPIGVLDEVSPQPEPTIQAIRSAAQLPQPTEIQKSSLRTSLNAPSTELLRQGLIENAKLIFPYLCFWPYWWWRYRCDELRVVETDEAGRFETFIIYPCHGDKPDLYFWVEYFIGGVWTTVYRPPIACNTYWNYACGTKVTLRVSHPEVPACDNEPDLRGLQVAVITIGNDVSISEIQGPGAPASNEGLTTSSGPFGGTLEPHVWFSRSNLLAAGINRYQWSFRRLTPTPGSWQPLTRKVGRHYSVIVSGTGDLTFPFETLGPDGANLFRIKPLDPPAPGIDWVVLDKREDTASAFFETTKLPHGLPDTPPPTDCEIAMETAGKYELKLELYRSDGTRVDDWEAEGILLKVATDPAPFGSATVHTANATSYHRILNGAGNTEAFRMVVHVDNNCCAAEIHPITGSGISLDPQCGFHEYSPGATVNIRFDASHPNNFATLRYRTVRGVGPEVDEATCSGQVGNLIAPADAGGPFTLSLPDTYGKTVSAATLLSSGVAPGATPCSQAAFAQRVVVRAMATDGWNRLGYLDRSDLAAFVLATPCDCDDE